MPECISGRYTVYEPIGAGGMATVHLGRVRGPAGFARTVVIKRLRSEHAADPAFRAMFADEARIAARIHHPNVASILDVVADEESLCLVLEYVHAVSLAELVSARPGPVPAALASAVLCGVLQGLSAAHSTRDKHGQALEVVHRDVSPQNILVGEDGVARLIDFGIARARARMKDTTAGQLKGKLAYVAPEQLRGEMVTPATDVYAAAVVLWEVATGRRLFAGDNEAWILEQIRVGFVEPPSKFAPELPEAFDSVVLKALSTHPKHRFQSAREMAAALESAVSPASLREVGEWVTRCAGDTLRRRERRLEEIEEAEATSSPAPEVATHVGAHARSSDTSRSHTLPVQPMRESNRASKPWVMAAVLLALATAIALLLRPRVSTTTAAALVPVVGGGTVAQVGSAVSAARASPVRRGSQPDSAAMASAATQRRAKVNPRLHPSGRRPGPVRATVTAATSPSAAPTLPPENPEIVQEAPF